MLTASSVEAMKPAAARREVPDALLPGLYFIVQTSGAKSWAVRYRANGRPKKHTIGSYPKIKLGDARELARAALRSAAEGNDPAAAKVEARRLAETGLDRADLVGVVFEEFDKRHLSKLRPSTAKEIRRLFERRILPKWRKRRMSEVSKRDVLAILDSMVASGAPISANRCLAAMTNFFNWSVARDILPIAPTHGVKKPTVQRSRSRVLTDDELRLAWLAAADIGWPFGQIVRLLILTGARREEVAAMPESELDISRQLWTLAANRAKNHLEHEVHLSSRALAVLRTSPRVRNRRGFVFSTNGQTAPSGFSRAKERIDAAMLKRAKAEAKARGDDPAKVKIPPWTFHDLRRTMASGMARLGIALPVIERCLNHVSGTFSGVVGIYQRHSFSDEQRAAFDVWSRHVRSLTRPTRLST
jgi:integrase